MPEGDQMVKGSRAAAEAPRIPEVLDELDDVVLEAPAPDPFWQIAVASRFREAAKI